MNLRYNAISKHSGLFSNFPSAVIPPVQFGVIGEPNNLPLDFEHAGGNIVAMAFPALNDAVMFNQQVRLFSTSGANQMRCAMYTRTGPADGNSLSLSPDTVPFDNSVQTLTFSQTKPVLSVSEYWLAYQASGSWRFFYDNSPGVFDFAFIGPSAFGVFPANFSFVSVFEARCQFWGNYVY